MVTASVVTAHSHSYSRGSKGTRPRRERRSKAANLRGINSRALKNFRLEARDGTKERGSIYDVHKILDVLIPLPPSVPKHYVPSLGVIEGLSCVIGLLGRYKLAATLGQHCP